MDLPPGGNPLHGRLVWERAAIVELFEASTGRIASWPTAAPAIDLVHESTVRRVLAAEGLILPGNPPREPAPRPGWPDWLEWKPNRIWAYDFTHWTRAAVASIAILILDAGQVGPSVSTS